MYYLCVDSSVRRFMAIHACKKKMHGFDMNFTYVMRTSKTVIGSYTTLT